MASIFKASLFQKAGYIVSKRILLITQWFDPEPTFKGLVFARELVSRGFDVEVITGFPNYPGGKVYEGYKIKLIQKEIVNGVLITRVPLFPSHNKSKLGRSLNYLSFFFSSLIYGLFGSKRPDVIYAYHPPITVALAAIIIKFFRRAPVVIDIQDMWPDTLSATGLISNKYFLDIISNICNLIYRAVNKIVVLSPGFKNLLVDKGVLSEKISLIYNWADENALKINREHQLNEISKTEGFNILFAGNIGVAQDLNVILDAALVLQKDFLKINFFILGKGLMLEELKARTINLGLNNVKFIPSVNMDEVGKFLNAADALFIHLKDDPLFKITVPGKTQAYMCIGKPILMGVGGDAKNLMDEANCGLHFQPENPTSLVRAAKKFALLPENELQNFGDNAAKFYEAKLSIKVGLDSFELIFNEVIENKHT